MASVTAYTKEKIDELLAGLEIGSWTDWTPTWNNWTPGNAVVVARYRILGKAMSIRLYIKCGSTTGFTSSTPTWTLPSGITIPSGSQQILLARGFDSNVFNPASGACVIDGGTGLIRGYELDSSYVTPTTPWTWAVDDEIGVQGELEIA